MRFFLNPSGRSGARLAAILPAFALGFVILTFSPAAVAVTYQWGNVPMANTLTSGDLCSFDGTYINCTTALSGISGTPGGSNTQIQYNNSGAFGGASNFVWNNVSNFLGLGTATASAQFHMAGGATAPAWTTSGIAFR